MRAVLLAVVVLAVFAGPASATVIRWTYSFCACDPNSQAETTFFGIVVRGEPGEDNKITVEAMRGGLLVTDAGAPVLGRCRPIGPSSRFCPGPLEDGADASLGDGDDTLRMTGTGGELRGGPGDDVLFGSEGWFDMDGGPGADRMETGPDGRAWISYAGRTESVTVRFNDIADDGAAGEHDDIRGTIERLQGGEADDLIEAGPGTFSISGGAGADVIRGGAARQGIEGGSGDDLIEGGDGDDRISGGPGADRMGGGDGRDLVVYDHPGGPLRVSIGDGPGDGSAGEGDDVLGDVEDLDGGDEDDVLIGDEGPNRLNGGEGVNTLLGGAGPDRLIGSFAGGLLDPGPGPDRVVLPGGRSRLRLADGEADRVKCILEGPEVEADALDTLDSCAPGAYFTSARPRPGGRLRVVIKCTGRSVVPCAGTVRFYRRGAPASRPAGFGPLAPQERLTLTVRLRGGALRRRECVKGVAETKRSDVFTRSREVDHGLVCNTFPG
jgi:Ca2+-binding RTX toxin-like protein